MTRTLRLVACGLAALLVAGGARAQSPAETIDAVMEEYARLDVFSGTVLVARGGDILYAEAFGEANKDHRVANILETRFNIGSIGKTLTGVAVMQLVEGGRIELDAPVVRYLPDFPFGDAITIHHLLSHTSGLANYMAHPEYRARMTGLRRIADLLPLIYDQQLVFDTPGEAFAYSNSGIVVLGAVIEKVAGQAYPQYLREQVLAPAGMSDTGIHFWDQVVPHRAIGYTRRFSGDVSSAIFQVPPASADGGIETTVLDLLKFDRALSGDVLLNAESKRKMFTPNLQGYGYCWRISDEGGHRSIGHGGGAPGVSASFMRYPDDDVTIIVLSNYSDGAIEPARALEAIMFGQPYGTPARPLGEVLYREITDGRIDSAAGVEAVIERAGDELYSSIPLNQLGYELLGGGDVDGAIAVFEVNASRFPEDPNCFDSLAEAYLAKGERDRAIATYRKALEVDPTFASSRRMLKQLTAEN
jgi:CubicO group peptidase (beta-lactamase class C family)